MLMRNRPQCQSKLAPLAWDGNFAYHYNGCLAFPASISVQATALRDDHLRKCGALTSTEASVLDKPQTQVSVPLPPLMHICIAHCTVLTLENGRYVLATPQILSVYVVEKFTQDSIVMKRTDTGSFALTATLTGSLSPSGDSVVDDILCGRRVSEAMLCSVPRGDLRSIPYQVAMQKPLHLRKQIHLRSLPNHWSPPVQRRLNSRGAGPPRGRQLLECATVSAFRHREMHARYSPSVRV